jgi:PhnB protein
VQTNTYLHFNGNCEEALKFYETATGGKIVMLTTHEGSPAQAQTPPDWLKKILHARIQIGGTVIMASDAPPGRYSKPQGFSISLDADSPTDAERIFKALSEGGTVGVPMGETFFAKRFGMLADRFDVPWMVICEAVT